MNKLKRYIMAFGIPAAVWVFAFCGPALLAQGRRKAPVPPEIKAELPWLAVIYSVVALVGICVVAFKDPKRTHLD